MVFLFDKVEKPGIESMKCIFQSADLFTVRARRKSPIGAKLERRTGISRGKLRSLKANNFNQKAHGLVGQKQQTIVLSGYSAYLEKLLRQGITNSAVCPGPDL